VRGAVRIVRETGKPIAQVARDLGVNEGTLGHWFAQDRAERERGDRDELLSLAQGESPRCGHAGLPTRDL
jgi:transposase